MSAVEQCRPRETIPQVAERLGLLAELQRVAVLFVGLCFGGVGIQTPSAAGARGRKSLDPSTAIGPTIGQGDREAEGGLSLIEHDEAGSALAVLQGSFELLQSIVSGHGGVIKELSVDDKGTVRKKNSVSFLCGDNVYDFIVTISFLQKGNDMEYNNCVEESWVVDRWGSVYTFFVLKRLRWSPPLTPCMTLVYDSVHGLMFRPPSLQITSHGVGIEVFDDVVSLGISRRSNTGPRREQA